jgi:hypothetical protein
MARCGSQDMPAMYRPYRPSSACGRAWVDSRGPRRAINELARRPQSRVASSGGGEICSGRGRWLQAIGRAGRPGVAVAIRCCWADDRPRSPEPL